MTDNPACKRIGFVGLGIMGRAMALNAKKAGFEVSVTNRTLSSEGILVCPTAAEVARQSDIFVTMVTGPQDVRAVLEGEKGLWAGVHPGQIFIQMSTIDAKTTISLSQEAAARKMMFLDCPVAGSKKQVEEAQLILLAGGETDVLKKAEPFLKSIGKAVVHAGPVGQGTALKLCMNLIVAQMTTALCEAVALAKIQQLDPQKIFDVISESPALNCGYFQIKRSSLLKNDYSPAFSLSNMLKDVRFIDQAGKDSKLPLPVTQAVRFLMEAAVQEGFGNDDLTAIQKLLWPKHLSTSSV